MCSKLALAALCQQQAGQPFTTERVDESKPLRGAVAHGWPCAQNWPLQSRRTAAVHVQPRHGLRILMKCSEPIFRMPVAPVPPS
jgi:hypothetical protein